MKKTFTIIWTAVSITILSCNNNIHKNEIGQIQVDRNFIEYDQERTFALETERTTFENGRLRNILIEMNLSPDNYIEVVTRKNEDVIVEKYNDTILIRDCQDIVDSAGHIAFAGYCYSLTLYDNQYVFEDNSWSDVIETWDYTQIEYSPFYLDKKKYQIGDTLKGGVTVKISYFRDKKFFGSKSLKFLICSTVQKAKRAG